MTQSLRRRTPASDRCRACTSPGCHAGPSRAHDSASSSPIASSQSRTCGPAVATPALEREQHVKVPQREGLNRKMQDRRSRPQLGEAENAIEPMHARRRGCPFADSRSCRARNGGATKDASVTCSNSAAYRPARSDLRRRDRNRRRVGFAYANESTSPHQRNQPECGVDDTEHEECEQNPDRQGEQHSNHVNGQQRHRRVATMRAKWRLNPGPSAHCKERVDFFLACAAAQARRGPPAVRATRSPGASSSTAACRWRVASGAAAPSSQVANARLPRGVAAGPSHWNNDARPNRSRSMAYG